MSWPRSRSDQQLFEEHQFGTVSEYKRYLLSRDYSCVLLDGSLLQLSWEFEFGELSKHRLCYFPCPVVVDLQATDGESLEEIVDYELLRADTEDSWVASGPDGRMVYIGPQGLRLRSPLRFDYCRQSASPDHPATHLTVQTTDCRLPVAGPLSLGRFVRIVFGQFYPAMWQSHPAMSELPLGDLDHTLTEQERAHPHISWSRRLT